VSPALFYGRNLAKGEGSGKNGNTALTRVKKWVYVKQIP
jgi:hypothetical protein